MAPEHSDLDLEDSREVSEFFRVNRPEIVILAAGKLGGILKNKTHSLNLRLELR